MFGPTTSAVTVVPCIVCLGQSNMDGAAQSERLANTLWNYKGILSGYPSTRVAQAQYTAAVTGAHIYNRSAAQASDWSLDDGQWEAYEAGVNSRNVTTASNTVLFGPELIVAQGIIDHAGGEVAIIKPAFAGVGLLPTSLNVAPGPYNNVSRTIALQVYLERAVRDWAAYNPGTRLEIVGVVWWQGETDANLGVTGANYVADLLKFFDVMNAGFKRMFVTRRDPVWNFVSLDFARSAAEIDINSSVETFAAAHGGYFVDVHMGKSLQKDELSAAQDDPLTKGAPTNASGNDDDNHSNYIAVQLIGEQVVENLITEGVI